MVMPTAPQINKHLRPQPGRRVTFFRAVIAWHRTYLWRINVAMNL
jgi:hypothetical protein